jgi:hypothetical protein
MRWSVGCRRGHALPDRRHLLGLITLALGRARVRVRQRTARVESDPTQRPEELVCGNQLHTSLRQTSRRIGL